VNDFEAGDTLIDAFRHANPVPGEAAAGRRARPSAHALFAEIVAQPSRRAPRRPVIAVVLIGVVLVAGVLAAFAVVDRGRPDVAASARCYEQPNLSSRSIVVAGPDLRTACAQLFENGDLGNGVVPSTFDVCVSDTGAPVVFPAESGSVCAALGLATANPSNLDIRVRAFESQVVSAVQDDCIGYDQAHDVVEQYLDRFGLHGWTVELSPDAAPFSDAAPCASLAFPAANTVTIVPVPDLHATGTS